MEIPLLDGNAKREKKALDCVQIQELLPHRPPFLFIDRVIEIEPGVRGVAIKNVTINEAHFLGHFPQRPVMPGVLLIEGCAQLGAIVIASTRLAIEKQTDPLETPAVGYLASVNRFKLISLVGPGDQLRLDVQVGKRVGSLIQLNAAIHVGTLLVASGEIAVSIPVASALLSA
jgi:3-hydroxyacyl-[acyl-carrier-protein] dehydratase